MTKTAVTSYSFQSIQGFSKILLGLLATGIMLSVVSIPFGLIARAILIRISEAQNAGADSAVFDAITADADQSDLHQMIIGFTQVAVGILTVIFFARWIYVASRNCHAVSGKTLPFSPGWSVGWYFVPIANLWKPYQAMRQTWNVSADTTDDPERPAPGLLLVWWLFFLVSSAIERAAFRQALRADEVSEFLTSNTLIILSDAANILATIVAFIVVKKIADLQAANFAGQNKLPPEPLRAQPASLI